MSILVFDCETTDLVHFDRPISDPVQPRMIQLAAVLLSPQWEEINHFATVIRPEGWASNAKAREAHGITERRCELYGVRQKAALAFFMDLVRSAREIASYNYEFDGAVIDIELDRIGAKPDDWRRGGLKRSCVMIEAAQRYNGGKNMKLPVAHEKATGIVYHPQHRALDDARAAIRILREMRGN